MESELVSPCKNPISSEDSRDSNVGPDNFVAVATRDADWKDETLEAPKMTAMENIVKKQSNVGDGNEANDGLRFEESEIELMTNRHFHANGLNDKNLLMAEGKVKGKERENRHFHANGLNDKTMIVGEKVEIRKMENRHFHANGLNDKNPMIEEKGEKVVRKEKESRHLRVNGLNNKYNEMAAEWNRRRAEAERKVWTQRANWNESRAGAEHQFGSQGRMESEYNRRWDDHNQERREWRSDDQFHMQKHK